MFDVAYQTDIGLKRSNNQDTIKVCEGLGLCLVADGMGGHKGGEIASEMAADTVEAVIGQANSFDSVEAWVKHAISQANKDIYLKAIDEPELRGMGTTCSLVVVKDDMVHIGHVGDSRIYFVSDAEIRQVTIDHTLVEDLIKRGELKREDAKQHPKRNVITRAVGTDSDVEVDYSSYRVVDTEKVLLCSDGLTGRVEDHEILEIVNNNSIDDAVKALIKLANDRGGADNISVVIMSFKNR